MQMESMQAQPICFESRTDHQTLYLRGSVLASASPSQDQLNLGVYI